MIERVCIVRSEGTLEVVALHNSLLSTILVVSSCVRNGLRFPVTIDSGVKLFRAIDASALNEIEWRLRLVVIRISIRQSACTSSPRLLGCLALVYIDYEVINLFVNLLFFDVLSLHFLFSSN